MGVSDFIVGASRRAKKRSQASEASVEEKFVRYCKANLCKALKLTLLNQRGFPDRTVICKDGRVVFFELKKKGGKQSGNQKVWQRTLEGFGFKYYLCYSYEEAVEKLDDFMFL